MESSNRCVTNENALLLCDLGTSCAFQFPANLHILPRAIHFKAILNAHFTQTFVSFLNCTIFTSGSTIFNRKERVKSWCIIKCYYWSNESIFPLANVKQFSMCCSDSENNAFCLMPWHAIPCCSSANGFNKFPLRVSNPQFFMNKKFQLISRWINKQILYEISRCGDSA